MSNMLNGQLFVDTEGYLLLASGLKGSLIVLTDELKDSFGRNSRIEVVLDNWVFRPAYPIKDQSYTSLQIY